MKKPVVIGLRPRLETAFAATDALATRAGMNTGNVVYAHAICSHLPDYARVLDIGAPPKLMNRSGEVAVIQAANQLGAHFDHHNQADRIAELEIGVVAVGLGAQNDSYETLPELPPSAVEWVRRIVERAPSGAPNLGVRGEFTVKVLAAHGFERSAEVIGCPSLFLNPDPRLGQKIAGNIREPKRVAVAAGHETWQHLADIEASLGRLVTETNGAYIGQHGLEMIMLTRGEAARLDDDHLRLCRDYVCPDMELAEFVQWCCDFGRVFFDVSSWIEYCRRFDFVVGTRIHGTAIALQAGVPALCIAHDSRTLELCQTMKVPYVTADDVAEGVKLDELVDLADFDAGEFDDNRRMLSGRYVGFLKNNSIRPAAWLEELATA